MQNPMESWSVSDSLDLYNVPAWGSGFFTANEAGHVLAQPKRESGATIDLKELVDDLRRRGYELPLLLRFGDILHSRIEEITGCMRKAIRTYEYAGDYRSIYPIKVNQQRHVVEELLKWGRPFHLGLEVGSKPEMLIALAIQDDPDALIICNGYKDEEYVQTALLAQKLGRAPILVMDRFRELDLILRVSKRLGVKPCLGVRARLQARGAGKWAESGGAGSKFGLTTTEITEAVARLRADGLLDSLQLLHFHLGSQIPSIRMVKNALQEASRVYVELHALGAGMRYVDVGGGLGVDYDGSRTNFHSSMNYTVQEYANDVVSAIQETCDQREVPHPTIVTESGRALVAHHAVLIVNVLDVAETVIAPEPTKPEEEDNRVAHELYETWASISRRNLLEPFHDALAMREEASQLFNLGYLDLEGRARADRLFFACCGKICRFMRDLPRVPEELDGLERGLADTYYCNFSVFQSMPDAWAVKQLFPIMPIHRLQEYPARFGTLADLTCDSDGKVDQFIDIHDVKSVLPLHRPNGKDYYLGIFLLGAYQEILGDLHNLFGDTNAIHVALDGERYRIEHVVEGDTVSEVLEYVEFDRRDLLERVRKACEDALWQKRMTPEETKLLLARYEQGLNSYTYLGEGRETVSPREPARAPASESRPRSDS
ncbi:MAG: biosynthetic arginine decarboxylase [Planctomycetota bacterium]|nr:biosynthetic arginine decarboxylase [Planctomycetota bacterium]